MIHPLGKLLPVVQCWVIYVHDLRQDVARANLYDLDVELIYRGSNFLNPLACFILPNVQNVVHASAEAGFSQHVSKRLAYRSDPGLFPLTREGVQGWLDTCTTTGRRRIVSLKPGLFKIGLSSR